MPEQPAATRPLSLPDRLRPWKSDLAAIALLALVTVAFFWKILLSSDYTIMRGYDASVQWYAWYRFAAAWVRQGILPLWDPFVYGGHSFIGEAQAGLFYPFNLLQAFLIPADRALASSDIGWMAAVHGFIGAASMYVFARLLAMRRGAALVSAIVFAFGGFVGFRVFAHISIYYGCVWLPLLLALLHLAITRRSPFLAVASGLGLGMVTLVGHLMPPVYSALMMGCYAFYMAYRSRRHRRPSAEWSYPLVMLALAGVFALGTAAVQMLPSLEYEKLALKWTGTPAPALRGDERSPYWVASGYYFFRPEQLTSFLAPSLNGTDEAPNYLGLLPLVLAAIAIAERRRNAARFFAVLGLAALLYALGQDSIVHGLAWLVVPILDKARLAVRALFVVSFAVALLAGYGMQALLAPTARTRRFAAALIRLSGYVLGALAVLAVGISIVGTQQPTVRRLDFLYYFLIMAFLAWIALALWTRLSLAPRLWAAIMIGVLLFDLLSQTGMLFQPVRDIAGSVNYTPEVYYAESGAVRFLQAQPGLFRVDMQNDVLSPNFGDVFQLYSATGHGNTMAADYLALRQLAWQPGNRLYDMLNIRYLVTTDTIKTLPLVYDGEVSAGDLKVYENPSALPRAWLVHQAALAAEGAPTWTMLQSSSFDPAVTAIVNTDLSLPAGGAGGTVDVNAYGLQRMAVTVDAPAPSILVTSENYYPGWIARVDGKQVDVLRLDGALRGVLAPAGRHEVVFSYEPRSFRIGALITLGTLLLALFFGLALIVRRLLLRTARRRGQ